MATVTNAGNGDNTVQLNDGIAVRPLRHGDVQSTSRHANNKNVTKYLRDRFPSPYTEADAKTWIEFTLNPENQARSGKWTLEGGSEGPLVPTNFAVTVNDEAVGGIGIDFGRDIYFRSAEIGYWLSEEHWGKGVMSRVVPAFVSWVWDTFPILVRLNGATSEINMGSQVLLKRAGFILEGRRENMICKRGEIQTELMFGALRLT